MKKIFIPAMMLGAVCLGAINASAQKTATITKLQATNPSLNWFAIAKQSFLTSQKKLTATSVMATRNVSNGKLELGPGFSEGDPIEREKSSTTTTSNAGKIVCKNVSKELELSVRPDFNILKFSSQGQIFPGVISTGAAILSESISTPVGLPARKPMTVNMVLPGALNSSIVLDAPGTVQLDKVNNIIRTNTNVPLPAMAGLEITEVDSKFDFAAQLETSSGLFLPLEEFGIPAEVNAGNAFSGNVDGSSKRKTYLVKFIQPMFILSHNELNSANIFQDASVLASKSDLVLINSVTYGRMIFMRVVSEESAISLKSAIKAKLGIELTELNVKAGNSIEGSGSTNFSTVVKDFKAVVIGGNVTAASRVISDPNQLKSYIEDPSAAKLSINTGAVPISFTMVRLSDYALLGIRSVANFQAIEDCRAVTGYNVFINKITVSKVVDNPLAGNNEDLFGTISVRAFYKKADGTEVEIRDENGRDGNVWDESATSPVQLKENESKVLFKSDGSIQEGKRRFIFTPEQEATGYIIVKYRIKDKIMKDGEDLGNSNAFVKYDEKDLKFFLNDWQNQSSGACIYELKEIGGDAKLCIDFAKKKE